MNYNQIIDKIQLDMTGIDGVQTALEYYGEFSYRLFEALGLGVVETCCCSRGKGIDYTQDGQPYCIDCGRDIVESEIPPLPKPSKPNCSECLRPVHQEELDLYGGICEECTID